MAAAVVLAYVPRLPSPHAPSGFGPASGGLRITPGTNRRLRVFAITQIALSFVLLAGAGMILAALVALLIAVVGVAGVLAVSVSARTREFGVRLAIGSTPQHLLLRVLSEGAVIVVIGIVAGVAGGYAFGRVAASYFENVTLPGALPILGAAIVLVVAAIFAALMPAARASRVDVLQALRPE